MTAEVYDSIRRWLQLGEKLEVPLAERRIFAACLILGLVWGVGLGCQSSQEPSGDKAKKFRQAALAQLQKAKAQLGPLVGSATQKQMHQAMREFYKDSLAKGESLPCGLGVLDQDGVVLAGSFPDPQAPGGVAVVSGGKNYSQYDKIKQAIKGRDIAHFKLYTSDGTVYMICSPLNEKGRAGAVCLAFFGDTLHDELGVSDKDFASLNFN